MREQERLRVETLRRISSVRGVEGVGPNMTLQRRPQPPPFFLLEDFFLEHGASASCKRPPPSSSSPPPSPSLSSNYCYAPSMELRRLPRVEMPCMVGLLVRRLMLSFVCVVLCVVFLSCCCGSCLPDCVGGDAGRV
jgi:hypothetical protein